jgi:NMT1-like family
MKKIETTSIRTAIRRPVQRLVAISWRDMLLVLLPVLMLTLVLGWLAVKLIRPAPPDTVVILSGPEDSGFHNTAKRYAKIIGAHGIQVKVVVTEGSEENLQRLLDKKQVADVGLVQTGVVDAEEAVGLMSLGTMYVQPFLVFYRGRNTLDRLTQLKGKRIAIGPDGSGTRLLSLKMLEENEMSASNARLLDLDGDDAIEALLKKKVDAIFLTGEQVRGRRIRELMRVPGIKLMNLRQANGYLRRLRYLSRLEAPEGSFDLGLNLPPKDTALVGTPVELIAREGLHPAISDVLIAAAREVHGKPGMYRKAGEFPAPTEHEIPIGEEAQRYYTSGSPFLYKRLPFWLASLVDRVLLVVVPLLIVVVPLSRLIAPLYRWRVRSRIYRWYGRLMKIERDMRDELTQIQRADIGHQLAEIEVSVNSLQPPLAFADQLYVLREHIALVRAQFDAIKKQTA